MPRTYGHSAGVSALKKVISRLRELNIGYATDIYHAWISVYLKSIVWVDNLIQFDGENWSMMDPTMASTGGDSYDPSKEQYTVMFQR